MISIITSLYSLFWIESLDVTLLAPSISIYPLSFTRPHPSFPHRRQPWSSPHKLYQPEEPALLANNPKAPVAVVPTVDVAADAAVMLAVVV